MAVMGLVKMVFAPQVYRRGDDLGKEFFLKPRIDPLGQIDEKPLPEGYEGDYYLGGGGTFKEKLADQDPGNKSFGIGKGDFKFLHTFIYRIMLNFLGKADKILPGNDPAMLAEFGSYPEGSEPGIVPGYYKDPDMGKIQFGT
jgi:hypothetical protein